MSRRHFSEIGKDPIKYDLDPSMTLWFAFTYLTGISSIMSKLFVFTPNEISNNPVKDKDMGHSQEEINTHSP